MSASLFDLGFLEAADALAKKAISSEELTKALLERREVGERPGPPSPPGKIARGHRQASTLAARGAVTEHGHEGCRVPVGQRADQDRVHHTEDRGVGPNPKGHDEHGHSAESAMLQKRPQGETHVRGERHGPGPEQWPCHLLPSGMNRARHWRPEKNVGSVRFRTESLRIWEPAEAGAFR